MRDPTDPEREPDIDIEPADLYAPAPALTNGHAKANGHAKLRVPTPKPVVRVVAHEIHEAIVAASRAIGHAATGDPFLFQRAHDLVVVLGAPEPTPKDRAPVVEETPVVRLLSAPALQPRLCQFVEFQRHKEPSEKQLLIAQAKGVTPEPWATCAPPPQLVASMLAVGEWPVIRRLNGILETPSMRPDGSILDAPGYDAATRSLFVPNAQYLPVASSPSHSDAVLAYARLSDVFRDFPYVDEAHRSATIAALLTVIARPAIQGSVPCWLFDASAARSGKSLQTDVISLVVSGRLASRTTFPETDEELEKVLASYAISGARTINFDNVARAFGGAAIDKCITATDTVDLRLLGKSEIKTLPWTAVIMASGNNVRCRGDMLARVLSPRIESLLDNPEARADLVYPYLRAHVRAIRPELVHAALTLLRAYVAAGRPPQSCPRWGGFESWSSIIPPALCWVGAPDPMGARRGLDGDDDPTRLAEAALVAGWARLQGAIDHRGLTVAAAVKILYPARHAGEEAEPDGYDALRTAIDELTPSGRPGFPSVKHLGEALRRLRARPLGGLRLLGDVSGGVVRWRAAPAR